ncbi:hypothetical protein WDV93_12710 [Pantoea ananatis]
MLLTNTALTLSEESGWKNGGYYARCDVAQRQSPARIALSVP